MSVGSLYQYYPNRDALLAAVLERHLDGITSAVEQACSEHHGEPVSRMASALVSAFVAAKLRDSRQSKALYAVAEARGGAKLAARMHRRMVTAIAAMLAEAADARFVDPAMTATITLGALVGPVRTLLEGHMPAEYEAQLEGRLTVLVTAFLQARESKVLCR